jgi:mRNA-degrading endonuclease toxin of MazEF toxin-antitoxin module
MKSPHRGEVWLADLGMAAKVRPALAISVPADDADRALVTLVPHTRAHAAPVSKWSSWFHFCERASSMVKT